MIVNEVMSTKLVLVEASATLSHAANLMREHQIHHLPVIRMPRSAPFWFPGAILDVDGREPETLPVLEGLLTSHDIDIAVAVDAQNAGNRDHRPWQERRVAEAMHPAPTSVGPTSSVAAAAQLLVERGINCLPVVEYIEVEKAEARTVLVGLLTRSDLLMALARSMGAFQPGIEVHIHLPDGDVTPLATMLLAARELHIQVRSILAGPLKGPVPYRATVQLGTIHPAPLLVRLQQAGISYEFADFPQEHETDVQ